MTENYNNKDIDATVDNLQDKSRVLNESLKALSTEGFDKLARAVGQTAIGGGPLKERVSSSSIIDQELRGLLRQEVTTGFRDIFSDNKAAATGGGYSVVINNNTSAQVTARETSDGMDQKQLEVTIDQMVANSLLSGRQTSGVLRTLFGLAPTLIGR